MKHKAVREKEPKNVVRLFGVLGAAYEVDTAGMRTHRLSQASAVVFAAALIFRKQIGLTNGPALAIFALGFALLLGLSFLVTRRGKKL